MSKKSQQNTFEIYELLRAGLMNPSIVYIPMDIVLEYVGYEEIEELQNLMQPFDKLWICESLEINYHLEDDTNLHVLSKKQDILKKNLFDLMDYKQNLTAEQFSYLEKSYKQILYVCMFFSQEMVAYLSKSKNKELIRYLKLFELQDFQYQRHFEAIEEVFPTSDEEKKTWYTKENIDSESLKNNLPFVDHVENNTKKKVKNRKQQYITDQESQNFLLKTVFNIKL